MYLYLCICTYIYNAFMDCCSLESNVRWKKNVPPKWEDFSHGFCQRGFNFLNLIVCSAWFQHSWFSRKWLCTYIYVYMCIYIYIYLCTYTSHWILCGCFEPFGFFSMIYGRKCYVRSCEALFGSALAPMLLRLSSVEETSPLILGGKEMEKSWETKDPPPVRMPL